MATYKRKTDGDIDRRGRPPKNDTEVTSELLASGEATMAQLAQLFNTDAKTLPRRMKGVIPRGTRKGYKTYRIDEAASRIITPGYEIEEYIRQMSPQELPPLLQKEFWNGQRARIEYEKTMGDLWPTAEIVSYLGELMNVARMTILLVVDDVNREAELSHGQREIITRIMDKLISTMKSNIAKKLEEYYANRPDPGTTPDGPGYAGVALDGEADDLDDELLAAEDDEEEDIEI